MIRRILDWAVLSITPFDRITPCICFVRLMGLDGIGLFGIPIVLPVQRDDDDMTIQMLWMMPAQLDALIATRQRSEDVVLANASFQAVSTDSIYGNPISRSACYLTGCQ